jgi:hypothetical protein
LKDGGNIFECINGTLESPEGKNVRFVFVLLDFENQHARIKKSLDRKGIASQMLLSRNIRNRMDLSVFSNILKQVNSKCGLDLYRI